MRTTDFTTPLLFEPHYMERVWGGDRLATVLGRVLPEGGPIGESWELVDRPEAVSVVANGPAAGMTLSELWDGYRVQVKMRRMDSVVSSLNSAMLLHAL
jgi:mannose-6-phosphate isomerase class I